MLSSREGWRSTHALPIAVSDLSGSINTNDAHEATQHRIQIFLDLFERRLVLMNVGRESNIRVLSGFLGGGVAAFESLPSGVVCSVAGFAIVEIGGEGGQAAILWGFGRWENALYSPGSAIIAYI